MKYMAAMMYFLLFLLRNWFYTILLRLSRHSINHFGNKVTSTLSRNLWNTIPCDAVIYPKAQQSSAALLWKTYNAHDFIILYSYGTYGYNNGCVNDDNHDDNNKDDDDDDNNFVIIPFLCSSVPLQSFVFFFLIQRSLTVIQFQICVLGSSGVPRNFIRGGGSTNSVEDRENGDLGAVAP
jgi:hypothetical protein